MNNYINLFVVIVQLIMAALVVWISLRKAPAEKTKIEAEGAESWAKAAQIKADENLRLEKELIEFRAWRDSLKDQHYRIVIEFIVNAFGSSPTMGKTIIEPMKERRLTEIPVMIERRKESSIPKE